MTTRTQSTRTDIARRLIRTGTGAFLLAGLVGLVPATDYGRFLPLFNPEAAEAGTVALMGALTVATIFGIWERAVLPALATLVLAASFALNTGVVWPPNLPLLFVDCAVVAVLVTLYMAAEEAAPAIPEPRPFPERRFDLDPPARVPRLRPEPDVAKPPQRLRHQAPPPARVASARGAAATATALRFSPVQSDNIFRDEFGG